MKREDIIKNLKNINVSMVKQNGVFKNNIELLIELKKINKNITIKKILNLHRKNKFRLNYTNEKITSKTLNLLLTRLIIKMYDLKNYDAFTNYNYLDLKHVYKTLVMI